ncbi:hypothetical protein, partial [Pseudoneobacillus sp. C159]
QVTVEELLSNPDRYHGRNCRDPLEPEYAPVEGQIAKLFLIGQRSGPMIHSMAHGERNFALGWGAPAPSAECDFEALDPASEAALNTSGKS